MAPRLPQIAIILLLGVTIACTDDDPMVAPSPCESHACDSLTTCSDDTGIPQCSPCPAGYIDQNQDGTRCVDIDECEADTDDCADDTTCHNTPGSFACSERLLLVPDSSARSVGIYHGTDGHYCGDLVPPGACISATTNEPINCFSRPMNAILGPDERIYVSDSLGNRIVVFNLNIEPVLVFQVTRPRGLAFRGNELWVAAGGTSELNGGVLVFNRQGTQTRHVHQRLDGYDVLLLDDDAFLFSNRETDQVTHHTTGNLPTEVLATPNPEQLTPATGSSFFVGNSDTNRVVEFNLAGDVLSETINARDPTGIVMLGNGNVFVTGQDGVEIYRTDGIFQEWPRLPKFRARMVEWVDHPAITCDQ